MPESISRSDILESVADDAAEHWADHAARQRPFRHASSPQIDIVGRIVDGPEVGNRVVGEGVVQVAPIVRSLQSTEPIIYWIH